MRFKEQKKELNKLLNFYCRKQRLNHYRVATGPAYEMGTKTTEIMDEYPLAAFIPGIGALLVSGVCGIASLIVSPISMAVYNHWGRTSDNRIEPIKKLLAIIKAINDDKNVEETLPNLCKKHYDNYIKARTAIYAKNSDSKEYQRLHEVIRCFDEHFGVSPEFSTDGKSAIRLTQIIGKNSIYELASSSSSCSSFTSSSMVSSHRQ